MPGSRLRIRILIGTAVAIALYVVATSGNSPAGDATTALPASAGRGHRVADAEPAMAGDAVSAPRATALLARLAQRVTADGAAIALFARHSWYVAPPPPPPAPVLALAPPPPTAPPLPFAIMGSYARPGDATVYFLTREDRVFDVRVGDTVDGTYRIDSATADRLLVTYLPLNIQQPLAIGGAR